MRQRRIRRRECKIRDPAAQALREAPLRILFWCALFAGRPPVGRRVSLQGSGGAQVHALRIPFGIGTDRRTDFRLCASSFRLLRKMGIVVLFYYQFILHSPFSVFYIQKLDCVKKYPFFVKQGVYFLCLCAKNPCADAHGLCRMF